MATTTHIDIEAPSGSLNEMKEFTSASRLVLSDNGVGIFLQFGPKGCQDKDLTALTLTPDQVRELRFGLESALGDTGEL